mgnify:CR=1 FL=1
MEKIIKIVDVSTLCLYNERHRSYEPQWLNRNIGCIEIVPAFGWEMGPPTLNRNIGCIEIVIFIFNIKRYVR